MRWSRQSRFLDLHLLTLHLRAHRVLLLISTSFLLLLRVGSLLYIMRSLSLFSTVVLGLLVVAGDALLNSTVQWPVYIKYETVTGYFLQDDPSTNATTFNYVSEQCNLG